MESVRRVILDLIFYRYVNSSEPSQVNNVVQVLFDAYFAGFQGENMCNSNGEFDKHASNAQQNKLHAPLLQFDASFAADFNQGCFCSPFRSRLQVGLCWT